MYVSGFERGAGHSQQLPVQIAGVQLSGRNFERPGARRVVSLHTPLRALPIRFISSVCLSSL